MFECITVTGRRISVKPMTGQEEHMLLQLSKDSRKKKIENSSIARRLISSLVPESNPVIDYDTLLLGEEVDILYLIRLVSLGPMFNFRIQCPNQECRTAREYEVDIREMKRDVLLCGDSSCECYKIKKQAENGISPEMLDGILTLDFSAISADHHLTHPKILEYTLPVANKQVEVVLPKAVLKSQLGQWAKEQDPQTLSKYLSKLTVHFDNQTIKAVIEQELVKLTSFDRFWLRDQIYKEDPGVDSEIEINCEACGTNFLADVEISGDFFLPRRAISTIWHALLLRSALENGTSVRSWTCL